MWKEVWIPFLEISIKLQYISLILGALRRPPPPLPTIPGKFQTPLWGSMDTSPPLEIPINLHTVHFFNSLALQRPPSPPPSLRNSTPFQMWGSLDIFWNYAFIYFSTFYIQPSTAGNPCILFCFHRSNAVQLYMLSNWLHFITAYILKWTLYFWCSDQAVWYSCNGIVAWFNCEKNP